MHDHASLSVVGARVPECDKPRVYVADFVDATGIDAEFGRTGSALQVGAPSGVRADRGPKLTIRNPIGSGMKVQLQTALSRTGCFRVFDTPEPPDGLGVDYVISGAVTEYQPSEKSIGGAIGYTPSQRAIIPGLTPSDPTVAPGSLLVDIMRDRATGVLAEHDHVAIDIKLSDARTGEYHATRLEGRGTSAGIAVAAEFGRWMVDWDAQRNAPIQKVVEASMDGAVRWVAAQTLAKAGARAPSKIVTPPPLRSYAPSADEELWIIERPEVVPELSPQDMPGSGVMSAKLPQTEVEMLLPLKHTDVKAEISGYIATTSVTQQFHNPHEDKIEAEYVFPLPANAAINEFIMNIAERRIRGIICEREQAEETFEAAKQQGYVASLLTQQQPNIFKQRVANIGAGREIDVNIKYFHTLAYADGWYEYSFPMSTGPRFSLAGGRAAQQRRPTQRSGQDISLAVNISAGVVIEEVSCPTHDVTENYVSPEEVAVALKPLDTIPNEDFVLRYKVAGQEIKPALLTHRDERGGFFSLMLYPPDSLSPLQRKPMEVIFVLDCSGTMAGTRITQAKLAVERALKKLKPDDTFQIIRFSDTATGLFQTPVPATRANVRGALAHLRSVEASDGTTMMAGGIRAALELPQDGRRERFIVLLSCGWVNNQSEILRLIDKQLGESRIFSFAVGHSVNGYLLERIAKVGKGAVAYIGHHGGPEEVMDTFLERISHPAMTDINIDWGAMQVSDVYPENITDLFVGRPAILTGRFRGAGSSTVRIKGKVGDRPHETVIPVKLDAPGAAHKALPLVWARMKIADLADQARMKVAELPEPAKLDPDSELLNEIEQLQLDIKHLALEYGLVSEYTEFIAVDALSGTKGGHGTTTGPKPGVQMVVVRERPDPNSPKVAAVQKGVQFESTEELGDWTKVKLGPIEGWVRTADMGGSAEERK